MGNELQLAEFLLKNAKKSPQEVTFTPIKFDESTLRRCSNNKVSVKQALQGKAPENERVDKFFASLPRIKRPIATRTVEESEPKKLKSFENVKRTLIAERIDSQEKLEELVNWLKKIHYFERTTLGKGIKS